MFGITAIVMKQLLETECFCIIFWNKLIYLYLAGESSASISETIASGLQSLATTSQVVTRIVQVGLNIAQQRTLATSVGSIGNFISTTATVGSFVTTQVSNQLGGGSTVDEVSAAAARASNAPNAQDLQSTIAPQLTTSSTEAELQPEIAQDDEASPKQDLPFIQQTVQEVVETINLEELSDFSEEEQMQIVEEIQNTLNCCDRIASSFVILEEDTQCLKKYFGKLNFLQNQNWIGRFVDPV